MKSNLFMFGMAILFTYLIFYQPDFFPVPLLFAIIIVSTIMLWFCIFVLIWMWIEETIDNLKTKWYRYQAERFTRKLERRQYGK